jgi:hypothetical protein
MKERLKWLCVGVGVMYGMQLLILLIIHTLIPMTAPPGVSNLLTTIVYTLVAFMAGGFVIGLMAERVAIAELAIATVVTLTIDVLTTFAGGISGMFLFSFAFFDKETMGWHSQLDVSLLSLLSLERWPVNG